jgi:hypothetical protein
MGIENPSAIISSSGLVYIDRIGKIVEICATNRMTEERVVIDMTEKEMKVCAAWFCKKMQDLKVPKEKNKIETIEDAAVVALDNRWVPKEDMPRYFFDLEDDYQTQRYPSLYGGFVLRIRNEDNGSMRRNGSGR